MRRFYTGGVNNPKKILVLFIVLAIAGAILQSFVGVNYDMKDYLPEDSNSTVSLDLMNEEFDGGIPNARVMVKDISLAEALEYKEKLKDCAGVTDVMWLDDGVNIYQPLEMADIDVVETYYKENTALFTVTIDEARRIEAVDAIREVIGDENAMSGDAVSTALATTSTVNEIRMITALAILIVTLVLIFTTTSWVEPFIVLAGLGATVDYAILLTSRYMELRHTMAKKEAIMTVIPTVTTSLLTSGIVLSSVGFLLNSFSSHGILAQLGLFLGRGTLLSMVIVFFVLPGLLYIFDGLIKKTTLNSNFK
ncbi:MAG: MMPL family transporter [Lachnospiraceae bacterium]|nr:MMPL family transporter [Lachnospiraceae bacterium]